MADLSLPRLLPLIHDCFVVQVLIVGLKGVGIETAKNLILAGPGMVTLVDDQPVEIRDLGSNFFLTEKDVGHPRAGAVVHKLAELNGMVTVRMMRGPLDEALVAQHNVVVFSNTSLPELLRWNEFCHSRSIAFIAADVRGVTGSVFSDFGTKFTVRDVTGENPVTRIITHIANDEAGTVTLLVGRSSFDGWC